MNFILKSNKNLSLTESFGEYCPLIIDIDLKYMIVVKKDIIQMKQQLS